MTHSEELSARIDEIAQEVREYGLAGDQNIVRAVIELALAAKLTPHHLAPPPGTTAGSGTASTSGGLQCPHCNRSVSLQLGP
jgi:hypothetical protein